MNPNITPLRDLPPDGACQAIEELLEVARGLGLNVSPAIRPALWAEVLGEHHFNALRKALMGYAGGKGSGWLNTPGDILAQLPNPDLAVWARIEARLANGNVELAPVLTVRELLAVWDVPSLGWEYTQATHPLERSRLRDRYLAALRTDRTGDPRLARALAQAPAQLTADEALAHVLAGPGLDMREAALAERNPHQLAIEDALRTMTARMIPARA